MEFALVFPIFLLVLFGIIVFGLYIFFNQQVTNAAREGARYAAVHSATAQCATVSWHDPNPAGLPIGHYDRCDRPEDGWPFMTGAARQLVWGPPQAGLRLAACWSGYQMTDGTMDAAPTQPGSPPVANSWVPCSINGANPTQDLATLPCPGGTGPTDDTASSLPGNHVTVYACFVWAPPLGGVLFMPNTITIRAVVTEVLQRQQ